MTASDVQSLDPAAPEFGGDIPPRAVNPDHPNSWWAIAHTDDIPKGHAVACRVLERDLVLWRDNGGKLHCQAAHCLHLGAPLGKCGRVKGESIQCGFHGWQYDADGKVCAQIGHPRSVDKLRLATYRIFERNDIVYLWNGDAAPDHVHPDPFDFYGLSRDDYFTVAYRVFMPVSAKAFAENIPDAMHLAVAHGTAEEGTCNAVEISPVVMRYECRTVNERKWYTLKNLIRVFREREISNFFTTTVGELYTTSFGATIHYTFLSGTPFGWHLTCWTPIDADTNYVYQIDIIPRLRIPLPHKLVKEFWIRLIRRGMCSTVMQDMAFLRGRVEPVKPPYARFDRGLLAFRRAWDARIPSAGTLAGDGLRSNGARAGIKQANSPAGASADAS